MAEQPLQETKRDPQTYGIFMGWDGDCYYVDGRLTRNQARHAGCQEDHGWYRETTAHRVWMRDLDPDEASVYTEGETESFFLECPKDHPDAVAMWKVVVSG